MTLRVETVAADAQTGTEAAQGRLGFVGLRLVSADFPFMLLSSNIPTLRAARRTCQIWTGLATST